MLEDVIITEHYHVAKMLQKNKLRFYYKSLSANAV
jgi:hypothetical protein